MILLLFLPFSGLFPAVNWIFLASANNSKENLRTKANLRKSLAPSPLGGLCSSSSQAGFKLPPWGGSCSVLCKGSSPSGLQPSLSTHRRLIASTETSRPRLGGVFIQENSVFQVWKVYFCLSGGWKKWF